MNWLWILLGGGALYFWSKNNTSNKTSNLANALNGLNQNAQTVIAAGTGLGSTIISGVQAAAGTGNSLKNIFSSPASMSNTPSVDNGDANTEDNSDDDEDAGDNSDDDSDDDSDYNSDYSF